MIAACQEVGPALFFSLLIITVSFLPVFTLESQEGRLFSPLAYTKTFAMFAAAILSITLAPPLMVVLLRGRFRTEAIHCERLYFGEDTDAGPASSTNAKGLDKISEETALIHGNIDVLKPMLFSETPQPVVRRRWRGDGRFDETDAMAAEAAQRLATYMLDTEDFDGAMAAGYLASVRELLEKPATLLV